MSVDHPELHLLQEAVWRVQQATNADDVKNLLDALSGLLQAKLVGNRMVAPDAWAVVSAMGGAFPLKLGRDIEQAAAVPNAEARLHAWLSNALGSGSLSDFCAKLPTQPQIVTAYATDAAARSKPAMAQVAQLLEPIQGAFWQARTSNSTSQQAPDRDAAAAGPPASGTDTAAAAAPVLIEIETEEIAIRRREEALAAKQKGRGAKPKQAAGDASPGGLGAERSGSPAPGAQPACAGDSPGGAGDAGAGRGTGAGASSSTNPAAPDRGSAEEGAGGVSSVAKLSASYAWSGLSSLVPGRWRGVGAVPPPAPPTDAAGEQQQAAAGTEAPAAGAGLGGAETAPAASQPSQPTRQAAAPAGGSALIRLELRVVEASQLGELGDAAGSSEGSSSSEAVQVTIIPLDSQTGTVGGITSWVYGGYGWLAQAATAAGGTLASSAAVSSVAAKAASAVSMAAAVLPSVRRGAQPASKSDDPVAEAAEGGAGVAMASLPDAAGQSDSAGKQQQQEEEDGLFMLDDMRDVLLMGGGSFAHQRPHSLARTSGSGAAAAASSAPGSRQDSFRAASTSSSTRAVPAAGSAGSTGGTGTNNGPETSSQAAGGNLAGSSSASAPNAASGASPGTAADALQAQPAPPLPHEMGVTLKLLVELPPRVSDAEVWERQGGACAGCRAALAPLSKATSSWLGFSSVPSSGGAADPRTPRRCHYTGGLYCGGCHTGQVCQIPAQVLHNWELAPQPVCCAAAEYLQTVAEQPLLCVPAVNPNLYARVPLLGEMHKMRQAASAHLAAATAAGGTLAQRAERLAAAAGPRAYMLSPTLTDFWAMSDLGELSKGPLSQLPAWMAGVSRQAAALAGVVGARPA